MDDHVKTAELRAMMKRVIAYGKTRSIPLAPEIVTIPAANYIDPARFEREVEQIFKRIPLMLAPSAELPNPGDFKTVDAVGVPVLLTRGDDGEVRGFPNSCSHRGANVVTAETGRAGRFTCPYHGWTYGPKGDLIAVASAHEFGEIDKSCHGLTRLKVAERAGLIWVTLDRHSTLDIDGFLSGYDGLLERFGFANWHLFSKRVVKGPNWKVAYDGYLDFYHLPVLHKDTFGPVFPNQAIYSAWGPHQRVQFPMFEYQELEAVQEGEWPDDAMLGGVWTIFPHISIASFDGGGRGVMLSQLLPGDSVGESVTTQFYLMENMPSEEMAVEAHRQFDLLRRVVIEEDYATGLGLQRALKAGTIDRVTFGRNETGAQLFHQWVDRLVEADDRELGEIFRSR